MYVTLVFWLALFLPGYAVLRRWFDDESESGLLGVVALSYLLTLGLLSPVSILCYVLSAPLWVFAAYIVIIVAVALADLTRARAWGQLAKLGKQAAGLGLLIVVLDVAAGAIVGAHMLGDAQVHLARIRFIVDHGFSNMDPFVAAPHFYPIYHTNLFHALQAACAKLTGVDHFGVWFVSLAWAKLLVTSAAYYLGWSVFRHRLAGWSAALFAIAIWGPVPYTLYPNKLAPLYVTAIMFAVVVRMLADNGKWRPCCLLAIGTLLLGQIHGLYGAFAGLAFGPVLFVGSVRAQVRKLPQRRTLIVAVLSLALAVPFLLASVTNTRTRSVDVDTDGQPTPVAVKTENFHHFEGDRIMFRPEVALGNVWWYGLGLMLVATFLGLRSAGRGAVTVVLVVAGTIGTILFVPTLCTLLLQLTHREWVVSRLQFVFLLSFVTLVSGSLAMVVEHRLPITWLRGPVIVLLALAAIPYGAKPAPLSWRSYAAKLADSTAERQKILRAYRGSAANLKELLEPGATVLAEASFGVRLVMVADCFIVAAHSSSVGVLDLARRREDLQTMMDNDAPIEQRRELLQRYDVRYFVSPTGESPRWQRDWVKDHQFIRPLLIVEFDSDAIGR